MLNIYLNSVTIHLYNRYINILNLGPLTNLFVDLNLKTIFKIYSANRKHKIGMVIEYIFVNFSNRLIIYWFQKYIKSSQALLTLRNVQFRHSHNFNSNLYTHVTLSNCICYNYRTLLPDLKPLCFESLKRKYRITSAGSHGVLSHRAVVWLSWAPVKYHKTFAFLVLVYICARWACPGILQRNQSPSVHPRTMAPLNS